MHAEEALQEFFCCSSSQLASHAPDVALRQPCHPNALPNALVCTSVYLAHNPAALLLTQPLPSQTLASAALGVIM